MLTRVASFGVQVVASNSTQTGTGTETAQGVDVLVNGTST
jgi:formate dehydrogenase assembly factor FdhD